MSYAKTSLVAATGQAYIRSTTDIALQCSSRTQRTTTMTAIDNSRALSPAIAGRMTGVFHTMLNAVSNWNDARVTRNSLSRLSARELDDIGLSFGDIDSVATRSIR
jgi:uncharacterized protein YjiS (DUF1127 family)